MLKVFYFSFLLLIGLVGSQVLPGIMGSSYSVFGDIVRILTMAGLSFIMIHVGYEFDIDKSNLKQYGWDYVVAFSAASFPWILVTLYFTFVLLPPDVWNLVGTWKETMLAGRFAAPTSAGVLFSMLAAAGLGTTWLYRKARILAIFDDLDTVLLMVPLKMLMVGLAWQLGLMVFVMAGMVTVGYVFLHKVRIPANWPWVFIYSALITGISELIYKGSKLIDESIPFHIEVLLPAFILGCVIAYPKDYKKEQVNGHGIELLETKEEKRVAALVAGAFMILVGLSMPLIISGENTNQGKAMSIMVESSLHAGGEPAAESIAAEVGLGQKIGRITASQPSMLWGTTILHVLLITVIANIGKMFPAFCYRREAHWRERLSVSIGMWPRGEVGAGVLVISMSYGIGGPIVTIAMLSLALNLVLTGLFIYFIKKITRPLPDYNI